jgi:hypothetical protein
MKGYKMLFQDILKNTPENFPDQKDVQEALSTISEIAIFVNEGKRQNEYSKLLVDLAKLVKDKYSTLVQSYRQFKKEGLISLTYPKYEKHGESFKVYLFQDMLLLLEAKEKKISKRALYFIFLSYATIVPSQSTVELRLDVFNEGERRLIYIAFQNEAEKNEWENLIKEYIENEKSTVQNKGIDTNLIKLGEERSEVKKNIDENLRTFKIVLQNFDASKTNLLKLDADILNHERQLQALQQQIQKEKESRRKLEETLIDLTTDQHNIMGDLQKNLGDILEKDKTFAETLKGEQDAFIQIFGQIPSTEKDNQKLIPVIQEYIPKVQFQRNSTLPGTQPVVVNNQSKPLPQLKKPLPNPKSLPQLPSKRDSAVPPKRPPPTTPVKSSSILVNESGEKPPLPTKSSSIGKIETEKPSLPSRVQSTSSPSSNEKTLPLKTTPNSVSASNVTKPTLPSKVQTTSTTINEKPVLPSKIAIVKNEDKPVVPSRGISSPTTTTSSTKPDWKKNIHRRDSNGVSGSSSVSSTGKSVKEMIEQQNKNAQ